MHQSEYRRKVTAMCTPTSLQGPTAMTGKLPRDHNTKYSSSCYTLKIETSGQQFKLHRPLRSAKSADIWNFIACLRGFFDWDGSLRRPGITNGLQDKATGLLLSTSILQPAQVNLSVYKALPPRVGFGKGAIHPCLLAFTAF